jgi:hypothetical protein
VSLASVSLASKLTAVAAGGHPAGAEHHDGHGKPHEREQNEKERQHHRSREG